MSQIDKLVKAVRNNIKNVKYSDLEKLCNHYFGEPRQLGTSHKIYKMPWQGDPRVNIQKGKNEEAKPYQVKQVIAAINKIEEAKNDKP